MLVREQKNEKLVAHCLGRENNSFLSRMDK